MTRDELLKLRDKLFKEIVLSTRCAIPIASWSMEDRVAMTTVHMQYQAVVCQLHELRDDRKYSDAIVALDECRGTIWDILHRDGLHDKLGQKALEQISHALTLLGV